MYYHTSSYAIVMLNFLQVVQGSYAYVSPEGTPIQVTYIADENGKKKLYYLWNIYLIYRIDTIGEGGLFTYRCMKFIVILLWKIVRYHKKFR